MKSYSLLLVFILFLSRSYGQNAGPVGECNQCHGTGRCGMCKYMGACECCKGTGKVTTYTGGNPGPNEIGYPEEVDCNCCKGTGRILCYDCHGTGVCIFCHGTGKGKEVKQTQSKSTKAQSPSNHGYFTETNRIYATPPSQVIYKINTIALVPNSPEGKFLSGENQKFNSGGQNSQTKTTNSQKTSYTQEEQQLYVKQSAATILSEYHHEPPATEVLDKEVEESGKKESWRDAFKKGFKWIFDVKKADGLLVSNQTIADPNIRRLVNNNTSTIKLFTSYTSSILNNPENINGQLDQAQSELQKDFMGANGKATKKDVLDALNCDWPSQAKDYAKLELKNSALEILHLPGEE